MRFVPIGIHIALLQAHSSRGHDRLIAVWYILLIDYVTLLAAVLLTNKSGYVKAVRFKIAPILLRHCEYLIEVIRERGKPAFELRNSMGRGSIGRIELTSIHCNGHCGKRDRSLRALPNNKLHLFWVELINNALE